VARRPTPRPDPRDEPPSYAHELVLYAGGRLDAHALHAWITQRLVLDLDLDHLEAEVLAHEAMRDVARRRRYFSAPRPGRSRMSHGPRTRRLFV
jgi:hypothetical protein